MCEMFAGKLFQPLVTIFFAHSGYELKRSSVLLGQYEQANRIHRMINWFEF